MNDKDIQSYKIYKRIIAVNLLVVCGGKIYLLYDRYAKRLNEQELILWITKLFEPSQQAYLKTANIKDAIERIRNTPSLQVEFTELATDQYVNTQSGVFDVETGELVDDKDKLFSYVLDFNYISDAKLEDAEAFHKFVDSVFPDETDTKTKQLLEILGYLISDCIGAKAAFFLIGASNSGKSTILEVLKKLFQDTVISAIPLHRLENRFNIARLDGKKLNICTEISEKSFAALDIFKQLTSNEVVTAEHKGKNPFEFRLRCKSVNAGNLIPDLNKIEGMDAIINRMIVLFFPVSIEKEAQDLKLAEKLWDERDIIFSLALDALVSLKKNNFIFTEASDSKQLKEQLKARSHVFEDFLSEMCEMNPEERCHISALYAAFNNFCETNFLDVKLSKNHFSQKLSRLPGVEKGKFRLDGSKPMAGVKGMALKEIN